jgi:hypothetical protein
VALSPQLFFAATALPRAHRTLGPTPMATDDPRRSGLVVPLSLKMLATSCVLQTRPGCSKLPPVVTTPHLILPDQFYTCTLRALILPRRHQIQARQAQAQEIPVCPTQRARELPGGGRALVSLMLPKPPITYLPREVCILRRRRALTWNP